MDLTAQLHVKVMLIIDLSMHLSIDVTCLLAAIMDALNTFKLFLIDVFSLDLNDAVKSLVLPVIPFSFTF